VLNVFLPAQVRPSLLVLLIIQPIAPIKWPFLQKVLLAAKTGCEHFDQPVAEVAKAENPAVVDPLDQLALIVTQFPIFIERTLLAVVLEVQQLHHRLVVIECLVIPYQNRESTSDNSGVTA